MKTESQVTKKEIEVVTTTYSCEVAGCSYSTTDSRAAKKHHGERHAVKNSFTNNVADPDILAADTFLEFETEKDFSAWNAANCGAPQNKWSGPGWYAALSIELPCSGGCCSNYACQLTPASEVRDALQQAIDELDGFLGSQ